ncbi:unnamed protein product [Closterium sp. NIES-64]|nr:unnamed protein product [Closterium sp. NIES-64]
MREVVTLQFGSYANFVGAHFWNLQVRLPHAPSPIRLPPCAFHHAPSTMRLPPCAIHHAPPSFKPHPGPPSSPTQALFSPIPLPRAPLARPPSVRRIRPAVNFRSLINAPLSPPTPLALLPPSLQDEAVGRQGEGGAEQNGAGVEESVVMQWREMPGPAVRRGWAGCGVAGGRAVGMAAGEGGGVVDEQRGSTPYCTPRLLAIDYKGCLGPVSLASPLHAHGGIAAAPSAMPTWSGPSHVSSPAPLPLNPFLRRLLHPPAPAAHTASSAPNSQARGEERHEATGRHGGGELGEEAEGEAEGEEEEEAEVARGCRAGGGRVRSPPWTRGGMATGARWGGGREGEEEVEEGVRRLAEECDALQGFSLLLHATSPFASLATRTALHLAAEFPRAPKLLFSLRPPDALLPPATLSPGPHALPGMPSLHDLSSAVSLASLLPLTSLILPLGLPSLSSVLPHVHASDTALFHSSALLATAIDALSSPFRLAPRAPTCASSPVGAVSLRDYCALLSLSSPHAALAFASLALPAQPLHEAGEQEAASGSSPCSMAVLTSDVCSSGEGRGGRGGGSRGGQRGEGMGQQQEGEEGEDLEAGIGAQVVVARGAVGQQATVKREDQSMMGVGGGMVRASVGGAWAGHMSVLCIPRSLHLLIFIHCTPLFPSLLPSPFPSLLPSLLPSPHPSPLPSLFPPSHMSAGPTSTVPTPLPPAAAAAAIHRALLAARPRAPPCIAHIAAAQQPLAIPLPFPRFFSADISKYGLILPPSRHRASHFASLAGGVAAAAAGGVGGGGWGGGNGVGMGPDVEWAPVVARAAAGRGGARHGEVLAGALEWVGGPRGGAGRQVVAAWGVEGEEVREMRERVLDVCGRLRGERYEDDSE